MSTSLSKILADAQKQSGGMRGNFGTSVYQCSRPIAVQLVYDDPMKTPIVGVEMNYTPIAGNGIWKVGPRATQMGQYQYTPWPGTPYAYSTQHESFGNQSPLTQGGEADEGAQDVVPLGPTLAPTDLGLEDQRDQLTDVAPMLGLAASEDSAFGDAPVVVQTTYDPKAEEEAWELEKAIVALLDDFSVEMQTKIAPSM